jgi:N-acetylglucosamine-6-phosphate deacetylase
MSRFAVRGRLLLDGSLRHGAVVVDDGRIAELAAASGGSLPSDVREAAIVAPGLIDIQVNGSFGVEVGEDPEAIRHLATRLPSTGVTAFLPTLVTSPTDFYDRVFTAFEAARNACGALPIGLHLEGPFLSAKRAGIHRRSIIETAPDALLDDLLPRSSLRLMTLAPEAPGALERIRRLRERGIVVSLGHTDASYEEFVRGVDAGASVVTHLYSAMSPFQHRSPGAVGAALLDDRVAVGLIVDGVHSHAASIQLALRAKGVERVLLVTDAVAGAGVGPGRYAVNGRGIVVDESSARLLDGTLAGSILTMDQALRNVVQLTGASAADALRMGSEVPARVLGLAAKGRLSPGFDADLVLLDDQLEVEETIVAGRTQYRRESPRPEAARPA